MDSKYSRTICSPLFPMLFMCFLSTLYIMTSMTHRLKVVPLQRITTLLDWDDVVNHLANAVAFNTQRISLDEHISERSPCACLIELISLLALLACFVLTLQPLA